METVRKLERIARRLPSYLKFRIIQYVVMNLFLVLGGFYQFHFLFLA